MNNKYKQFINNSSFPENLLYENLHWEMTWPVVKWYLKAIYKCAQWMAQFANASLCRDVGELEENSRKLTDLCWVFMDSKALHKWFRNLSTLVDTKARMSKMCSNSLSNRLIYLCSKGSNPAHSKKMTGAWPSVFWGDNLWTLGISFLIKRALCASSPGPCLFQLNFWRLETSESLVMWKLLLYFSISINSIHRGLIKTPNTKTWVSFSG